MPKELLAHFLPTLAGQDELAGDAVVVIDVLRASTTICFALAAGAKQVIPCLRVDEARELAATLGGDALLGGERGGRRIDGFHLGNSPREYVEDAVAGKTVVFTSTNGTRALHACAGAGQVLIGAFVNMQAVLDALADAPRVHLLCAGTQDRITREDVLAAGAMAEQMMVEHLALTINEQAQIAVDAWQTASGGAHDPQTIARFLSDTQGGRNLSGIGHANDIPIAAAINMVPVVPQVDARDGNIRLARPLA